MAICPDVFYKMYLQEEENIFKIMFENYRTFSYTLAGRPLVIETGKIAQLANGSCLVRYGDTVVLATATASEKPQQSSTNARV